MNIEPNVPRGALVIVAGVDINARVTVYEIVAYGPGYESWGLEFGYINEDPFKERLWEELDERVCNRTFTCSDGERMPVHKVAIDSGFATERVYRFTAKRPFRTIAIKGRGRGLDIPFLYTNPTHTKGAVRTTLQELNVDAGKAMITYWFDKVKAPGPGFCHLPSKDGHPVNGYGSQYDQELQSEELLYTSKGGSHALSWKKMSSRRNEALDVRLYAYGALLYSRFKLERLRRDLIRKDRKDGGSPFGARQAEMPDNIDQVRIRKLRSHDAYAYGPYGAIKLPGSASGFGASNWPLT
jgi:phage terminase large subunit GpA-like protein